MKKQILEGSLQTESRFSQWLRKKLIVLFHKKWFWIGLLVVIPMVIIIDLIITFTFILTNFYSDKWDPYLLGIGTTSAILGAIGAKKKILESKFLRDLGKLLFFIAIIWAFRDYGFVNTFLFMAGILLTTRILKWLVPKKTRK